MESVVALAIKQAAGPKSPIHKIKHLRFFSDLGDIISARTSGEGVKQGTSFVFSLDDVKGVLQGYGIPDAMMPEAFQYCQDAGFLERKEDGTFRVTSGGLANYNAMLRRL